MINKFYIGQIFEEMYPSEAADFCNNSQGGNNPCYVKEIEPMNGKRMFKIVPNDPPDPKEEVMSKIDELQSYLSSTDWYVPRSMETGEPIPEEVRKKRTEAREEISRLREELQKF